MSEDDNRNLIGIIVTGVIGFTFFLIDNQYMRYGSSLLLGALITYIVSTQLQKQNKLLEIRKKQMDETFIPLYLETKYNYQYFILKMIDYHNNEWKDISNSYKLFAIEDTYRKKIFTFYENMDTNLSEKNSSRLHIKNIVDTYFKIDFLNKIDINDEVETKNGQLNYDVFHKVRFKTEWIPITPYLILGLNPFENQDQNEFNINNCVIEYTKNFPKTSYGDLPQEKVILELELYKQQFNDYLKEVEKELFKIEAVQKIRKNNIELKILAEDIIQTFEKHIKKNYPIERL